MQKSVPKFCAWIAYARPRVKCKLATATDEAARTAAIRTGYSNMQHSVPKSG
jgi:hypothetical protein